MTPQPTSRRDPCATPERRSSLRAVDVLVTVGPLAAHMDGDQAAPDAAQAAEVVRRLMAPGDTILLKASRGVGLQAVAEALGA